MPKTKTLEDLMQDSIKDIYYAENKISKALVKMARKASNPKAAAAFEKHKAETEDQIARLDQVMKSMGMPAKGKKCEAIEGIIREAEEMMQDAGTPEVCDAALIAAGQKVEHYEIATYGTIICWAEELGYSKEAKILRTILDQEKKTDLALTKLAEGGVNEAAEAPRKAA